jgi:hypothetical protein
MRRLLLLPVLLLAGCGQAQTSAAEFEGTENEVAQTIEDLQAAAQSRKPAEICSEILARALADKLKSTGNDCVREMEKVTSDADDFELEVTDVTVTGTTATAKVRARKGGRDDAVTTFSLAREDGDWRLTDLGAS